MTMTPSPEPAPNGCPDCRQCQQRLAALEAEVQRLREALQRQGSAPSCVEPRAVRVHRADAAHGLAGPHLRRREATPPSAAPPGGASHPSPDAPRAPHVAAAALPPDCQHAIEGVVFTPLLRHGDERGWLMELFRQDELHPAHYPQMGYVSETRPGVVRGPHEHVEQTDLFVFAGPGEFRLYLWDARSGSPTHGRYLAVELGEQRPCAVLVPPGVVHAYKNVGTKPGWVLNLPNRLYRGAGRRQAVDEIRYEDRPESPYRVA
jgi:dTDP-4-dehydrorhamnose 3,5-epimerase